MKKRHVFQKQKCYSEEKGVLYIFANLFHMWIGRRQLDSRICLCIQSVAICCFVWTTWRSLTQESLWEKVEPLRISGNPMGPRLWKQLVYKVQFDLAPACVFRFPSNHLSFLTFCFSYPSLWPASCWSLDSASKFPPQALCSCFALCLDILSLHLCLDPSVTLFRCQVKFISLRPCWITLFQIAPISSLTPLFSITYPALFIFIKHNIEFRLYIYLIICSIPSH